MKIKNEFIIEDVFGRYKDKVIFVTGRNCDDKISIGNIYNTLIIRILDSKDRETSSAERPTLTVPIDLKLISVSSYGKKIPFLGQGYTGSLQLTGVGVDLIKPSAWGKDNAIVYLLASIDKKSKTI